MKAIILFVLSLFSAQDDAAKLEKIIKDTTAKAQKAYVFIGGGSGVIVTEDGYFFTNHHVAGTVKQSQIFLTDGSKYKAKKIATDPVGDIALFKIESDKKFDYVEFADTDKLEVGQYSIAIGNPFLLGTVSPTSDGKFYPSISVGIVSAFHRHQGTYFDCVQTDAALNPGNSGGPLIDIDGKLIGINGRIAPRFLVRLNSGVGYAIPSNRVKRFMKAMLKAEVGSNVYPGEIFGLSIASEHTNGKGARVREVKKDSTAEKSGFKEDDVIVQVDSHPVTSSYRYWSLVGTYPSGEEITLTVERKKDTGDEKETVKITVTLDKPATVQDTRPKDAGYLGVQVEDFDDGVKITKVTDNSPAGDAGIQEGDIILKLDGKKVETAKDFLNRLWKKKNGDSIKLVLSRFGNEIETKVILGKNPKE